MAEANFKTTCKVSKDLFVKAVTDYPAYPKFVDGCTKVDLEKISDLESIVTYHVSMMGQTLTYKLKHVLNEDHSRLTWDLVSSDKIKKNSGKWIFKSAGAESVEVDYTIDIEFNFPIPGFILTGLVKGSLPKMISGIESHARSLSS